MERDTLENRIEQLESNLGLCFNNIDLIKQIIEYLEEATIETLTNEMRKDITSDKKMEETKNVRKREIFE